MFSQLKKILIFLNLIINYGVSPSTILKNDMHLKNTLPDKLHKDKNKHGMRPG